MTFQKKYEIAKKSMMKKVEEKKNQKIIRNPPKNQKMLGIHPKVTYFDFFPPRLFCFNLINLMQSHTILIQSS